MWSPDAKLIAILIFDSAGFFTHEAREAFLSPLVFEGRAEWMDKGHRKCLILWHQIQDWVDILLQFAKDNGLEDGVVTIEEIRFGTESQGILLMLADDTGMLYGMKYFNDFLMEVGPIGNVQSEVLLHKNKDTFTFKQGWAFPRRFTSMVKNA